MPSTKDDGTATAADQLGSTTLDDEPDAKNGTNPTKLLCSACGKESDTLKKCTACKCVSYCDRKCQKRHHGEHKKECKPIKKILEKRGGKLDLGTELDVGPLGKLPPQEECPICMRALPLHATLRRFSVCCGKAICCGCDYQHCLKIGERPTCAFCRTAAPRSSEEALARLRKRVDLKDARALCNMGMAFGNGEQGLPLDQAKCIELMHQSADLGFPTAQYHLGNFHEFGDMGLEPNRKEALKYYKEAAEGGIVYAMHNLGCAERDENGDFVAAMRHWRLSASGGYKDSMDILIKCFEGGFLRHGDLAKTAQAFYLARNEMKSEERDQYIACLKTIGKYETGCEC